MNQSKYTNTYKTYMRCVYVYVHVYVHDLYMYKCTCTFFESRQICFTVYMKKLQAKIANAIL